MFVYVLYIMVNFVFSTHENIVLGFVGDYMTTVEFDFFIRQVDEIINDNTNLIFVGDININHLEDKEKRVQATDM